MTGEGPLGEAPRKLSRAPADFVLRGRCGTNYFLLLGAALIVLASFSTSAVAGMKAGFNHLLDAVVRIDVREATVEEGVQRYEASIGSGVILSADGLILTNAHVVSPRAVQILVTLANLERVSGSLVGWDHWTDLGVIRLDLEEMKRKKLTFAHADFGDSDALFPGETVYAVGTPHGMERTVTRGIISNNRRYFQDTTGVRGYETGAFNTWLQTDAAINPGNSGGPLVTEEGKVIGINARAYSGADNLGFAIPSASAKRVMAMLARDGAITRSYLGVVPGALQDLETFYSLKQNTGMLVNSVDPGSPAAKAGLHGGDIVLSIDGVPVDGRFPEQLPPIQNRIANLPVGATAKLTIKRAEQVSDISVVTEKLESRQGEEWAFEKWGLSVRKISRAFARENQLPDANGLLVIGVRPGFPAEVAGVARGDIITKIKDEVIDSLAVAKTLQQAFVAAPAPMLIEVRRHRQVSLFVLNP